MKKIFLLFSNFNLLCSARQALSQGLSLCEFVLKVNLHVCFFCCLTVVKLVVVV